MIVSCGWRFWRRGRVAVSVQLKRPGTVGIRQRTQLDPAEAEGGEVAPPFCRPFPAPAGRKPTTLANNLASRNLQPFLSSKNANHRRLSIAVPNCLCLLSPFTSTTSFFYLSPLPIIYSFAHTASDVSTPSVCLTAPRRATALVRALRQLLNQTLHPYHLHINITTTRQTDVANSQLTP